MSGKDNIWYVSDYNLKPEVLGEVEFPEKLKIYDTTLRDGEQTVGITFNKEEKVALAKALDELGVDRIEAGMPVVSSQDKEACELIVDANLNAEIWGFCRSVKADIDACIDVGIKSIICEIPTSPYKLKAYGFTTEQVLKRSLENLVYAKEKGLYTAFFAVDATRSELEFLEKIYTNAAQKGHADELVIVDTLGVASPETMYYLTNKVKEWTGKPVMAHCHNDFGMGVACTLATVKAGAETVQVTLNGLGEKTGNADLAEVVFASMLYGIQTNINFDNIYRVAKFAEKVSGVPLSPMKPVVGENVFRRESGVVVAQLVNYPPAVEGYSAELVGREREILLGKKSGKKSVEYMLQKKNVDYNDEMVEKLLKEVKALGMQKKGTVTEEEFEKLLQKIK